MTSSTLTSCSRSKREGQGEKRKSSTDLTALVLFVFVAITSDWNCAEKLLKVAWGLHCVRKRDTSSCQTSVSLIQHACNVWPLPTRAAILLDRVDIGSRLVATAYVQRATNNETVEAARLQLVCGAVPVYTRPSAAPTTITLLLRLYRCVLSRQSSALREPCGCLKRRYAKASRFI